MADSTFESKLKQWIPEHLHKFNKLTGNRSPYEFCAWSSTYLRYRFLKKAGPDYYHKRVFIDEIEAAIDCIKRNGRFDRDNFRTLCAKTNSDGSCGYCVIGRIMESFGIAVYSPKEHRFNMNPTGIGYNVSRSKFSEPIKAKIDELQNALNRGEAIAFQLPEDLCEESGYSGRIKVTIQSVSPETFDTDWSGTDVSRFPARIKAAATALRDLNFSGEFEIYHSKGEFQIKAV